MIRADDVQRNGTLQFTLHFGTKFGLGLLIEEVRLLTDTSHHWVVRSLTMWGEVCTGSLPRLATKSQIYQA